MNADVSVLSNSKEKNSSLEDLALVGLAMYDNKVGTYHVSVEWESLQLHLLVLE